MARPAPTDRQVFLALTLTRWLPVGFMAGIPALLALERGLNVEETLSYTAAQGLVVVLLELPTSGFSDAFGRKPILVAAAVLSLLSLAAFIVASSFAGFALAAGLAGLFRALDSGPLEAWYVDRVHARDPEADVAADLGRQTALVGGGIAAGALAAGGLILWHPIPGQSALLGPLWASLAFGLLHLAATALLLPPEGRHGGAWAEARASLRRTPSVIAEGLGLLRTSRVLAALIAVELFWGAAVVVVEQMAPIRLAEILGDEERAGAWSAPAGAASWIVFAGGAGLAGWLAPRIGTAPTAILGRLLHGAGAVAMGLSAGPVALVATLLAGMGAHGLANPPHAALLHREARSGVRATVLSLNSLIFMGSVALAAPLLGAAAGLWSTPAAMIAGGAVSLLGALLYLPALRRERGGR